MRFDGTRVLSGLACGRNGACHTPTLRSIFGCTQPYRGPACSISATTLNGCFFEPKLVTSAHQNCTSAVNTRRAMVVGLPEHSSSCIVLFSVRTGLQYARTHVTFLFFNRALLTGGKWNFQWRSGRFKPSEYRQVREEQRLNHFPRSALITRQGVESAKARAITTGRRGLAIFALFFLRRKKTVARSKRRDSVRSGHLTQQL